MPGELRVSQAQVRLLDPAFTTDQPDLQTLLSLVYEPVLRWEDGEILPGLAESWQLSGDGKSILLRLRQGARFHDGKSCTAEDIVRSLERLRTADGAFGMGGVYAPYLSPLRLETKSEHELRITSPEIAADLVDILAAVYVGRHAGPGPALGTGPYLVESYEEDRSLRLFLAGQPDDNVYEVVSFMCLPTPETRLDALKSGAADVATGLETLPAVPEPNGYEWKRCTNTLSVTAFLNGFTEPFDQDEARLAINLAVDVGKIVEEVWGGLAKRASTVVSPYHYGYPKEMQPLVHDPERARRLFAQVSMPGELVIRTPQVIPDRAPQVAQLIQKDLAEIGIRARIEEQPDRPLYAREVSQKKIGHIALFDSSPLSTYRALREKLSSRIRGLWWQGVTDGTADLLISAAHTTVQPSERREAYGRCLQWLHDHPHWLYLYHPTRLFAIRHGIAPVTMNHGGFLRLPGVRT